ncbi:MULTISPECIES: DIP1984 family protein [Sporosarcina]|uniref:DIP1984 family protein n=1 Tax=Sporosarcina TaxID=1569 RepID=UPI00058B05AA|nr:MULTISPECIES: DIP1984 family protein [Sporosarcina]WJY27596.1 DIP1984 family protein [Sporosarcina sp. 0.2-SM1T-5]
MKLAEALIERADYQKRIEQLKKRIHMNLRVQEGDEPAEDPSAMLAELAEIRQALTGLIKRINRTNCQVRYDGERTLADALTERDQLYDQRQLLAKVVEEASQHIDRYSQSEIRIVSTVDVRALQKQADQLSKAFREMDTQIQGMNWTIDLQQ